MMECVSRFNAPYNLTKKELYEKVLSEVKDNKTELINSTLYKAYMENLKKAVEGVLQSGQYGSEYFNMQQQFEANVSRFSAYKAHRVTKLLQEHDDPKTQKAILNTFNRYQAAEYNAAIGRARTAKQWNDFTNDPIRNELYPNLKWLPSDSITPREEHRIFWNKVWAKNDPFWRLNMPRTLWGCNCDIEDTDEPITGGKYDNIPSSAGLEGNPAKTGEIFTDNASYYRVENSQKSKVEKEYKKKSRNEWRPRLSEFYKKTANVEIENKPVKIKFDKYGLQHYLHDLFGDDYVLKNNLITYLDKVIEGGTLVAHEKNTMFGSKDTNKYKKNITEFFYFEVSLPNKKRAFITISKFNESNYRLYAISKTLRKTAELY